MSRILAACLLLVFSLNGFAQWKPSKPINIIVPWAAGGATDQELPPSQLLTPPEYLRKIPLTPLMSQRRDDPNALGRLS